MLVPTDKRDVYKGSEGRWVRDPSIRTTFLGLVEEKEPHYIFIPDPGQPSVQQVRLTLEQINALGARSLSSRSMALDVRDKALRNIKRFEEQGQYLRDNPWHAPVPGDHFRCKLCGEALSRHPSLFQRVWGRLFS